MTHSTNIHWTEDQELLEQFILHRLDEARRKELEAHLLVCEECQLAVKNEQELVLGIKRVGREEMKARLKERIAGTKPEPSSRQIPWVRVLSAAAIIVILVGVGIYDRWFTKEQPNTSEQLISQQQPATAREIPEAQKNATAEQEKSKHDVAPSNVLRRDQASPYGDELLAKQDKAVRQGEAGQAMKLQAPETDIVGAGKKDAVLHDEAGRKAPEDVVSPKRIWVDGNVLRTESSEMMKEARQEDRQLKALQPSVSAQTAIAAKVVGVTVTELPLEELPALRQMRQQRLRDPIVQTRIEHLEGEIHFMVYRNNPSLKGKPQQAVLRQIGSDSLVISVGRERIGYKVQGGIDALTTRKK